MVKKYYLLENNKIYNTDVPFHKNYPYWEEKDGKLICVTKNGKTCNPCKYNKIIRKSNNKYNLISPGDLIIGNECGEYENIPYIVTSIFDNIDAVECGIGTYLDKNSDSIRKVYKLDSKDNYIRVI